MSGRAGQLHWAQWSTLLNQRSQPISQPLSKGLLLMTGSSSETYLKASEAEVKLKIAKINNFIINRFSFFKGRIQNLNVNCIRVKQNSPKWWWYAPSWNDKEKTITEVLYLNFFMSKSFTNLSDSGIQMQSLKTFHEHDPYLGMWLVQAKQRRFIVQRFIHIV